jgi:hypothetical protein
MKRLCGLIAVAAFVAVGCSKPAEAPATPAAFVPTPHGTLLQVMRGIPFPASNTIFDMQSSDPGKPPAAKPGDTAGNATSQYGGIAAYAGWNAVENAAVAIQETANLVMIPGRKCGNGQPVPNDQEDFKKWASELAGVAAEIQKFAQAKTYNEDTALDLAGKLSDACLNCHMKYRETPKQPDDRCMVGGAAPAAAK